MYKLCKTEQSTQRQRMLEAGLLAAMKTKRYEEITISDLCSQMDIPRKSFYRYFSSKDGALYALIDHTMMDFEHDSSILFRNSGEDVGRELHYFFTFWQQRKPLLDALERSGLSGVLVERAIAQAQNEFVLPRNPVKPEVRAMYHHTVTFTVCGLMSMVTRWHRSGYAESAAGMAQIATALLTKPLLGEK